MTYSIRTFVRRSALAKQINGLMFEIVEEVEFMKTKVVKAWARTEIPKGPEHKHPAFLFHSRRNCREKANLDRSS
jgi:hypothetical protein